ncbi:hypothetical protein H6P81_012814 [Aristolochia fimbriata]|uniref:Protein-lysine N-methyltransferase H6P81_012814 n=1 Tax=Aristolochia fimbriata TaxID=158543 RepID=A0AAV7EG05_ARIFI|nr:hypothetical protein H6P81_012814 [Aristolochia fimbriata]
MATKQQEERAANFQEEDGDDEDLPMLSSHTLEALKKFLEEQKQQVAAADDVSLISEDWRLSQFWYDRKTAETVAMEVRDLSVSTSSPIVCIACPTIYAYLKKIDPSVSVKLLEFDNRFSQYGNDFTFYDYNHPEDLPITMRHAYQIIVADPPYLSKECLEKVARTISFLKKPGECYQLLLTGEVQKDVAAELLGLHPCGFRPQHTNKLEAEEQHRDVYKFGSADRFLHGGSFP